MSRIMAELNKQVARSKYEEFYRQLRIMNRDEASEFDRLNAIRSILIGNLYCDNLLVYRYAENSYENRNTVNRYDAIATKTRLWYRGLKKRYGLQD